MYEDAFKIMPSSRLTLSFLLYLIIKEEGKDSHPGKQKAFLNRYRNRIAISLNLGVQHYILPFKSANDLNWLIHAWSAEHQMETLTKP